MSDEDRNQGAKQEEDGTSYLFLSDRETRSSRITFLFTEKRGRRE